MSAASRDETRARVRAAAEALAKDTSPDNVELDGLAVSDDLVEHFLAPPLARNLSSTRLSLRENTIGIKGTQSLFESLAKNARIVELDLTGNPVGHEGLAIIAKFLPHNDVLQTLRLTRCSLTGMAACHIFSARKALEAFAAALPRHRQLHHLDLAGNCLTDYGESEDGLVDIIRGVCKSQSLTSLVLSYNDLGSSGAKCIASTLRESCEPHTALRSLALAGNKLQADGARSFALLLRNPAHCTLHELDLADNDLSNGGTEESGIAALADVFLSTEPVRDPDCPEQISSEALNSPGSESSNAHSGPPRSSLWALNLSQNTLSCASIDLWARVLRRSIHLARLQLDAVRCTCKTSHPDATDIIRQRLEANESTNRTLQAAETHDMPSKSSASSAAHAIQVAVRSGAIAALRRLLLAVDTGVLDADLLETRWPKSRQSLVHAAVAQRDAEALCALLEMEAPVNLVDRTGQNPLHLAACQDDLALALLLVHHGASIFAKDGHGKIPCAYFFQDWMRHEIVGAASTADILVITGPDPAETRFGVRFVKELKSQTEFNVVFATSNDQETLRLAEQGEFRAHLVLAITNRDTARSLHFINIVKSARKAIAPASFAHDAPLAVISCDARLDTKVFSGPSVFRGAPFFDLSDWAVSSALHWNQIAAAQETRSSSSKQAGEQPHQQMKIATTKSAQVAPALRAASLRRFRPTLLQVLDQQWPDPQGSSQDAFREMLVQLGNLLEAAKLELRKKLAKELSHARPHLELERLTAANVPFVAIVSINDSDAGRQGAHFAASELQTASVQSWHCPVSGDLNADVLKRGLQVARAVLIVYEAHSGNVANDLETIATRAMPAGRPLVRVLVHAGRCFTDLTGHGLAAQLADLDAGLAPRFARSHSAQRLLQMERENDRLRAALKTRDLLCKDLRLGADRYEARFRDAIATLGPVVVTPYASAQALARYPRKLLCRLEQEALRLRHCGLRPEDQIDLSATLEGEIVEILELSHCGGTLSRAALEIRLQESILHARRVRAAVLIQAAWRGCVSRELSRRAARRAAAARIQRCFRRYQQRAVAWALPRYLQATHR
ncbi:NACHT, LRR and PYD domains-containing protein 12 [Hondaea fermentalgiana]|uniref:NACHT, LRR and PYD domains-containing protein 12 n=1 Tax=Hondaea fermentalgiana TaxID=2315210 RepID=A0A2R5GHM1_9STRA|nr:NACHT, LRR and PYD domains-containing protein 12 [Hondaea fermentalgiana]|eukprot:GBG29839.1 NACHT, LRR and PYD domains-containing protein 12 [Hondaea fermentalgiana]